MENETKRSAAAHVLVFPYPIQGHINPMLQFSKRLVSKGLKVTLIAALSIAESLPAQAHLGPVQIQPLFDGSKEGEKIDMETYWEVFTRVVPRSLGDLIEEYQKSRHPVKFIVYDCITPWVIGLARTKGIGGAPFLTQSATVHSFYCHVHQGALRIPIKHSLKLIPSTPLLRIDEMPSLLVNSELYPSIVRQNIDQTSTFEKADLLFINTVDVLEDQVSL